MSGRHRIRLQAAWAADAGGTAWTRSFGRPTGVAAADRIWLVVERPGVRGAVLNGRRLRPDATDSAAWRFDVTGLLRARNDLRLECDAPGVVPPATVRAALPEPLGIVSLEIVSLEIVSGG